MNIQQAKQFLTGPVMSVRPGYDADGQIDYNAVRNVIDLSLKGGSKTIMLTCGDSNYDILSNEEILELTQIVIAHTHKRAMVIAADRYYSTDRAVKFAKQCRQLGADMYMALPPDWAESTTTTTLAEHYAKIAEIMPVMIVTNRFIPRGIEFGLEAMQRAFDASPNIVAIKDDMCGTFAHDICMRFKDRAAIIAGGLKRNHMNMYPYGCDGYLSTFASFNPKISQEYWAYIERKDLQAATELIRDKDAPFFNYISKLPGNFDAAIHGMLEIYGLGQRFRRKPYHTLNDDELEKLRQFLIEKKLFFL